MKVTAMATDLGVLSEVICTLADGDDAEFEIASKTFVDENDNESFKEYTRHTSHAQQVSVEFSSDGVRYDLAMSDEMCNTLRDALEACEERQAGEQPAVDA